MRKTLEATNQLGGFNQRPPMRQYNKRLPYSRPYLHKDDYIDTLLSSMQAHYGNTSIELNVFTKTLLTYVYAIASKSRTKTPKVLQYRYPDRGIPINTWSDNAQE